jgi:hypothetical protein
MGVPLAGDFDVAVRKPVDSRMIVGSVSDLNNILNRYEGLICYVIEDQNLYINLGLDVWERINTSNVDDFLLFNADFNISPEHNAKVLYVNSSILLNVGWSETDPNLYPIGFNVCIIQIGIGPVRINSNQNIIVRNRLGFFTTAGQYSIISILRIKDSNEFLLYGDLV